MMDRRPAPGRCDRYNILLTFCNLQTSRLVSSLPSLISPKTGAIWTTFSDERSAPCFLFIHLNSFCAAFIYSIAQPSTHTHTDTLTLHQSISHVTFVLLKGNMMRPIDHHVVNHSRFAAAVSCISPTFLWTLYFHFTHTQSLI